jgi:hypothetical protein
VKVFDVKYGHCFLLACLSRAKALRREIEILL